MVHSVRVSFYLVLIFLFSSTYLSELCTEHLRVFPSHPTGKAGGMCSISGMCMIWNEYKAVCLGTNIIRPVSNWRDVVVLIAGWKYSVVW